MKEKPIFVWYHTSDEKYYQVPTEEEAEYVIMPIENWRKVKKVLENIRDKNGQETEK